MFYRIIWLPAFLFIFRLLFYQLINLNGSVSIPCVQVTRDLKRTPAIMELVLQSVVSLSDTFAGIELISSVKADML